ncbi:MAG: transcription elongation factor GreA [Bacillota bacterium]
MNSEKEVILTVEGLQKLESELEHLKTVRRKEVAERINQALEFGDISENSEYEDAKNEQGFIEGKILAIEKMLRNAKVINEGEVHTDVVGLGSKVTLKDMESGDFLDYYIVGSAEANPGQHKISNESPVGKALIGKKVNETITVTAPMGQMKYKIVTIAK